MSNEETKDCTRLPVVASLGDYPEIWLAPKCHDDYREWCQDDVWGECGELHDGGEPCAYQSVRYVHGRLLTDAKARLAEKDAEVAKWKALAESMQGIAEIAQSGQERMDKLRAHVRTDSTEALANALKEIERLKRTIEAGAENEIALVAERTELRAQLEQLQAAPAERELAVLREYRLSAIAFNNSHGWEPDTLEEAVELERKAEERLEAAEKACWEFYHLNPATADSDVREVSE